MCADDGNYWVGLSYNNAVSRNIRQSDLRAIGLALYLTTTTAMSNLKSQKLFLLNFLGTLGYVQVVILKAQMF